MCLTNKVNTNQIIHAIHVSEHERTFSKDDYKLRSEMIGLKLEKDRLEEEKEEGLVKENQLKGEIAMFEETLEHKDQLVRHLSLKV